MRIFLKGAFLASALFAFAVPGISAPFVLVTPSESEREQNTDFVDKGIVDTAESGAPVIRLISPAIGRGSVKAPIDIELVFDVAEKAVIDRESIRVYYGAWRIDVTERILGEAEFTEFGLLAKNAEVPVGKHKLLIIVRDSLNREGRKLFKFKVK